MDHVLISLRDRRDAAAQRKSTPLDIGLKMPSSHQVTQTEIGMVRIYMKPKDRFKAGGGRFKTAFSSRPLYQELVHQAKRAGLVNAVAHHTHYGFSNHQEIQAREAEGINVELTMCVELVASRDQLETFCREHGDLLKDKVIVYKHLEQWKVGPNLDLVENQVEDPKELGREAG
jgi:PII-like signaling protein